jgi:hypothetical protein
MRQFRIPRLTNEAPSSASLRVAWESLMVIGKQHYVKPETRD